MRWAVWLLISGCGRIAFDPLGALDGAAAGDAGCVLGPWTTPAALSTVNSPVSNDESPTLDPSNLTLVFNSSRAGTNGGDDLMIATRTTTASDFGPPSILSALDSAGFDSGAAYSSDGLTLYFSSDRVDGMHYHLYRATRAATSDAFQSAQIVPELSGVDVSEPDLSADGRELFFTQYVAGSGRLFRATFDGTSFSVTGPITELDVGDSKSGPSLSSDGRTLYFGMAADASSADDLYMATRAGFGAAFGTPVRVDAVDDPDPSVDDSRPSISLDDRTIVFDKRIPPGTSGSDLYISTRACQ